MQKNVNYTVSRLWLFFSSSENNNSHRIFTFKLNDFENYKYCYNLIIFMISCMRIMYSLKYRIDIEKTTLIFIPKISNQITKVKKRNT